MMIFIIITRIANDNDKIIASTRKQDENRNPRLVLVWKQLMHTTEQLIDTVGQIAVRFYWWS